ncbi:MAG: putative serine/threonine-protein kinase Nek4 [Streblomastix strix]|uniref:non-specific serine/threonine protein kinase n=1 Tax=Streblomastix strix TaxID=222440 RepID=A0A5J4V139_9EUKA|nr:MAG: putative serine/threonine-protein kinase Nek4 [Streblomastix strix]
MSHYEDYRVIRQLPGGAQSKTYLVELRSTRQQFIMKKVDYLEDVDRAKVDVEVELMRSLDSDFTVHLVCTFPDLMGLQLCMILEYCVRGDFRNLIDEFQQLPKSEKLMRGWEYTAQITRALDHLHSHNVMHRDLKPANILVNQDGTIRLGDFGLSREMNEDYYLTIAGTKVYMAPEVHLLKRMDRSSDIFSLGVIIFQLITGHHPYEADSEEAMIDKIKKNKVLELPDWVSNQMKEVIKWMMNIDPIRRPTTKMILSHDTVLMTLRESQEKERAQVELIRERTEKDQEKRRADTAQVELNRANTQIDQEKQRTNNAEELTRIFQSYVETTQSEVTRLTSEVTRLNRELQIRETVPSTLQTQLKQIPVPTPKPKQQLLQVTSSPQATPVEEEKKSEIKDDKETKDESKDKNKEEVKDEDEDISGNFDDTAKKSVVKKVDQFPPGRIKVKILSLKRDDGKDEGTSNAFAKILYAGEEKNTRDDGIGETYEFNFLGGEQGGDKTIKVQMWDVDDDEEDEQIGSIGVSIKEFLNNRSTKTVQFIGSGNLYGENVGSLELEVEYVPDD